MRPKVIILGDSHATALAEAVRLRLDAGTEANSPVDFFASRFAKLKANGANIPGVTADEVEVMMKAARKSDVLVSVLGGNQYNTLGLLESPAPFDLVDPVTATYPDAVPGVRIVPLAQMSASFDTYVAGIRARLSGLQAAFPGRVFHVNSPPPKGDNAYIKKNAEGYFRSEGKVVLNVNPPGMRRRLWLIQSQALSRMCSQLGIEFVDGPNDALDEEGFLARSAYGADATHANAAYGELMLQKLERMVKLTRGAE